MKNNLDFVPFRFDSGIAITEALSKESAGKVFVAALEYGANRIVTVELNPIETVAFLLLKRDIDMISLVHEGRKQFGNKGVFHHAWDGGITPENQKQRNSGEYNAWRSAVFKRDDFTCQRCGSRGGVLNAHHIKPWAKHKNLRFDVNNGITLCEDCHKKEHRR